MEGQSMIKWKEATKEEHEMALKAAKRASEIVGGADIMSMEMDLIATHVSGCPLDFEKLMQFDDGNFMHDIGGINRHFNRNTGELEDAFLPRCAKV